MNLSTKQEFRDAWLAGRLGNRLRSWRSYEELLASNYQGCVSFRMHTPDSCSFMYRMDKMVWELRDTEGNTLSTIHEYDAMMDKRFCRDRWYPDAAQVAALPSKPKLKEPCHCGMCDRCLGLC